MQLSQNKFEQFSKQCAVLLGFVIPISTLATHIVLTALVLSWFFGGNLKEKTQYIFKHPVARITLLLFSIFLIGTTYSTAPAANIFELLDKMSKLLYLPFLLPLMTEEKWRKRVLFAFMAAIGLTLILSLFKVYGGFFPSTRYSTACIFKDHIYTNLMMAFASFVIGHLAFNQSKIELKVALLTIVACLVFYIFFMSEGRSGYIIFAALWLLLGLQRYRLRGLWIGCLGLGLVLGLAYVGSARFEHRISLAATNLEEYVKDGYTNSSLGSRIEYIRKTWVLSKERLWLGWGTGSFKQVYQENAETNMLITQNPHNEYLNILIQIGLVGLCTFFGFFWIIFKKSFYLPKLEMWFAQGLLVAMMVGCFANSWLMDSTAGYFFIVFIACCFGALKLKDA